MLTTLSKFFAGVFFVHFFKLGINLAPLFGVEMERLGKKKGQRWLMANPLNMNK